MTAALTPPTITVEGTSFVLDFSGQRVRFPTHRAAEMAKYLRTRLAAGADPVHGTKLGTVARPTQHDVEVFLQEKARQKMAEEASEAAALLEQFGISADELIL